MPFTFVPILLGILGLALIGFGLWSRRRASGGTMAIAAGLVCLLGAAFLIFLVAQGLEGMG